MGPLSDQDQQELGLHLPCRPQRTQEDSIEQLLVLDLLASEGMQSTLRTFNWMFEEEPELKREMLAHLKVSRMADPTELAASLAADSPSNPSPYPLHRRSSLRWYRRPSELPHVFRIVSNGVSRST